MTPSKDAKDYAEANGFRITPNGKRYQCEHVASGTKFERGSYPALLNEMRAVVNCWTAADDRKTAESITHIDPATLLEPAKVHCDVVRDDGALGMYADTVVGGRTTDRPHCGVGVSFDVNPRDVIDGKIVRGVARRNENGRVVESRAFDLAYANVLFGKMATAQPAADPTWWSKKTAADIKADIVACIESLPTASHILTLDDAVKAVQTGTGVTLDRIGEVWKMRKRLPDESDAAYRNLLLYGTTSPFDSFNEESKKRIRHTANRIAKQRRKASGKPPGGPWHVIFNGRQLTKPGYPTRAAAVAVVRWGFNHSDATIRNNWRTAALSVEYR